MTIETKLFKFVGATESIIKPLTNIVERFIFQLNCKYWGEMFLTHFLQIILETGVYKIILGYTFTKILLKIVFNGSSNARVTILLFRLNSYNLYILSLRKICIHSFYSCFREIRITMNTAKFSSRRNLN